MQKGLSDYLETKRAAFSRFYFLSNDELLEILSETKDPQKVQPHLKKCFEAMQRVTFDEDLQITEMVSAEKEIVAFIDPINPVGRNVEDWMTDLETGMKASVKSQVCVCRCHAALQAAGMMKTRAACFASCVQSACACAPFLRG